MLNLSNCPRIQVEVTMAKAYNRWLCDKILTEDPRIKSMLYLPFHDPEASYEIVKEFAPYVGVEWARKLGDTARFARAGGEDANGVSFVLGVRAWF